MPFPYHEGLALEAAGDLDEAFRLFRKIGAVRDLRRVEKRIGSRRAARLVDPLSAREREIALLVAEGATNQAISAQLFLSARTVETHVARVFAKLRVHARSEVAAAYARVVAGAVRVTDGAQKPTPER